MTKRCFLIDPKDGSRRIATTLRSFFAANRDGLSASEIRRIRNLKPGKTFHGGGGAAGAWSITRKRGCVR